MTSKIRFEQEATVVPVAAKVVSIAFVLGMIVLLFEHTPFMQGESVSTDVPAVRVETVQQNVGTWNVPPAGNAARDDPPIPTF